MSSDMLLKPNNPLMTEENLLYLLQGHVPELLAELVGFLRQESVRLGVKFNAVSSALKFVNGKLAMRALARTTIEEPVRHASEPAEMALIPMQQAPPAVPVEMEYRTTVRQLHQQLQSAISIVPDTPLKTHQRTRLITAYLEAFRTVVTPLAAMVTQQYVNCHQPAMYQFTQTGDAFLYGGIMFRFATSQAAVRAFGSRENAVKMVSHERKGIGAVLGSAVPTLHVPLCAQVHFLGHCLWVTSHIDLTPDSLVYGSLDGGRTIVTRSQGLQSAVKRLAEALYLKGHSVKAYDQTNAQPMHIHGPADLQGYHSLKDDLFYIASVSRMFPQMAASFEVVADDAVLSSVRRLRPEALFGALQAVNSDVFSSLMDPNQSDELEVQKASDVVILERIPLVMKELETMSLLDSEELIGVMHRYGVNCRYMGQLAAMFPPESRQTAVLSVEMVARTFRHVLEDAWYALRDYATLENPLMGPTISIADYESKAEFYFHLLLDAVDEGGHPNEAHRSFWTDILLPRIGRAFGAVAVPLCSKVMSRPLLFQRACQLTGVRFALRNFRSFMGMNGLVDLPPAPRDIQLIPVVSRPIVLLSDTTSLFADGKLDDVSTLLETRLASLDEHLNQPPSSNPLLGSGSAAVTTPLIPLLHQTAKVYTNIGGDRLLMAEACLQRILLVREMDRGTNDPCYVEELHALAELFVHRQRFDNALTVTIQRLELTKQIYGPSHPNVADVLNDLGSLYFWIGKTEEAQTHFHDALGLRQNHYGPDHPKVADSHIYLGLFHTKQSHFDPGISHLQLALAILTKAYEGCTHPEIGKTTYHLAVAKYNVGNSVEALALFQKCLPILEQCFGAQDSLTLSCAAYIRNMNLPHGAIVAPLSTVVHPAAPRKVPTVPDIVGFLEADHLRDLLATGRYLDAVPIYQKLVDTQEEMLGPQSPEFINLLTQLAQLYLWVGRPTDAVLLTLRALTLTEAQIASASAAGAASRLLTPSPTKGGPNPTNHLVVADRMRDVSEAYEANGDYGQAVQYYEMALRTWERVHAKDPRVLASCLQRLAELHQRFKNYDASLTIWHRVLQIRSRLVGEQSIDAMETRARMDELLREMAASGQPA